VEAASRAMFGQGDLAALDDRTLAAALAEVPGTVVGGTELPPVADLLADSGLVPSKSAARRVITEGGAYLNNVKVTSVDATPDRADLLHGRWLVLRRGKRNVAAVEVKPS
jgi:tyrosyl-tRNA synthetase